MYPNSLNNFLANLPPVPCNGVYTIFKLSAASFIASGFNVFFFNSFIYKSSKSGPITLYRLFSIASSFDIVLISAKSVLFTSAIISPSIGSDICAPSSQYTLYPLYFGGLWLAVTTIPDIQPNFLTANDNSGVGLKDSNIYVFIPFAFKISAASSLNSVDICLESYAIATPLSCPPIFTIYFANP